MTDYAAIYWTRAVPWAGFRTTSTDPEKAAQQSKTIRYQRELARRHVAATKGARLLGELVFFENTPDRTDQVTFSDLKTKITRFPAHTIWLWTDFHAETGWRKHRHLKALLDDVPHESMTAIPLPIDGHQGLFDPASHFKTWQHKTDEHAAQAPEHRVKVQQFLLNHPAVTWRDKAAALNEENLWSHTGRAWNADNLRKYLGQS